MTVSAHGDVAAGLTEAETAEAIGHAAHAEGLPLTEAGLAERFVRAVTGRLTYVAGVGWHEWRDGTWTLDVTGGALRATGVVPRITATEELLADDITDDRVRRRWERVRTTVDSLRTRRNILEYAASDARLVRTPTELNRDPELLAVTNGTLDLRTGELRRPDPADLITERAAVAFDPDATCPRFDELLTHAFRGDPVMISYVWRALGYCLTGLTGEQVFFFLWGVRGSSKSTIAETMRDLMGTYGLTLDEGALTGGAEQHPTWVTDLLGKRFVVKDELDQKRRINTARLNTLVGGGTQRGRRMRSDFVDVPMTAKFAITTNHRPPMGNAHDGVWRRIHPWRFTVPVAEDAKIQDFHRLLVAEEGPGILNRCLEGLADYREGALGLRVPQAVLSDAQAYREFEDDQTPFIADVMLLTGSEDDWVANPDVYGVYRLWCAENGVDPLRGGELSKLLVAAGFTKARPRKAVQALTGKVQTQRGFTGARINVSRGGWLHAVVWSSAITGGHGGHGGHGNPGAPV